MCNVLAALTTNQTIVAVVGLVAIITMCISFFWFIIVVKNRDDLKLKQSMVDRGMSAEEIVQVLKARN